MANNLQLLSSLQDGFHNMMLFLTKFNFDFDWNFVLVSSHLSYISIGIGTLQ